MPKFKKKPVVIEAVQWIGTNEAEIAQHVGEARLIEFEPDLTIKIHTLEGVMTASRGDWIIKGIKGEIYPHKPDFFYDVYELVES